MDALVGTLTCARGPLPPVAPCRSCSETHPPPFARRASLLQDQSPMHLQTPRILAVRDLLHMSLMFNSFGAYAPQIPRISVNAKPIGKASNAKRWSIESYAKRTAFVVPTLHSTRKRSDCRPLVRQYCQPSLASNSRVGS